MSETQSKVWDLIFGRWRSQILYAGVKLGIFDVLGSGRRDSRAISSELQLDPSLAYRLLRALGALELLKEGADRTSGSSTYLKLQEGTVHSEVIFACWITRLILSRVLRVRSASSFGVPGRAVAPSEA